MNDKIYRQVEHQMGIDWGTGDVCVITVVEVEDGKIRHMKNFWTSDKPKKKSLKSRVRKLLGC